MDCSSFRDDLVDVLYGEAPPDVRARIEAHLTSCAPCREEMASLRAVRTRLQQWKAPAVRPLLWRRSAFPAHTFLAAAAALVLGVGAAWFLRGSEIRYEDGRFSARLGRSTDTTSLGRALEEQEARHQRDLAALRAELLGAGPSFQNAALDEPARKEVEAIVEAREAAQVGKFESRLLRFADQVESRRRYDLARVGASLAYLDGKNGQQLSRTTELMGYVLEANQKGGAR